MLRTVIVVCIGYVFDVAPSFRQAIQTFAFIIKRQRTRGLEKFFNGIGLKPRDYIIISIGALIVLIASFFQEKYSSTTLREILDKKNFYLRWFILLFFVFAVA